MSVSLYDSAVYGPLFSDQRIVELFSDQRRIETMLSIEVDLQTGMSLSSIESRYHDVDIHPSLQGYRVFLANPDTRSDRVFELNWTPEFGSEPVSTLSTFDDGDAVYAMLMLAPLNLDLFPLFYIHIYTLLFSICMCVSPSPPYCILQRCT